jgi:hypothetical protein
VVPTPTTESTYGGQAQEQMGCSVRPHAAGQQWFLRRPLVPEQTYSQPKDFDAIWTRLAWIFDIIAMAGTGAIVLAADVKSAYRNMPLKVQDLHLFVRKLVTEAFGIEFFMDLKAPFGWINSYWLWESIGAIITYALKKRGIRWVVQFADNWFIVIAGIGPNKSLRDEAEASRQSKIFYALMHSIGMPMHEQQISDPEITILGAIVNPRAQTAKLKPERLELINTMLSEWVKLETVTVKKLEQLTGLWLYVAGFFKLGLPDLVHFFALRTKGQKTAARLNKSTSNTYVKLSKEVKESLRFWQSYFSVWDGSCTISLSHGPCAKWDDYWYCDAACTPEAWGAGAWSTSLRQFMAIKWSNDEQEAARRKTASSSAFIEALALVKATRAFGPQCQGKNIVILVDAQDLSIAFQKGYAKDPALHEQIVLARTCALTWNLSLSCIQIPGARNKLADALSRGKLQRAKCLAMQDHGPGPWIQAPALADQPSCSQALSAKPRAKPSL